VVSTGDLDLRLAAIETINNEEENRRKPNFGDVLSAASGMRHDDRLSLFAL
jgi:hypothetical protein